MTLTTRQLESFPMKLIFNMHRMSGTDQIKYKERLCIKYKTEPLRECYVSDKQMGILFSKKTFGDQLSKTIVPPRNMKEKDELSLICSKDLWG